MTWDKKYNAHDHCPHPCMFLFDIGPLFGPGLNMPSGIAIDNTNVKTGVPDHTVGCMLLDACVQSGFVIQQVNTNGTYSPVYNLSSSSTPAVVAFLKSLNRPANVYAKVVGVVDASGQLVVSGITDAFNLQVTGWIYDNLCLASPSGIAIDGTNVKTGVPQHTVGCMLLPQCQASNFVLQQSNGDGTYSPIYSLTSSSTPVIVDYLKKLQPIRSDNVYSQVTGNLDKSGALVVSAITDAYQIMVTGWIYDNLCKMIE